MQIVVGDLVLLVDDSGQRTCHNALDQWKKNRCVHQAAQQLRKLHLIAEIFFSWIFPRQRGISTNGVKKTSMDDDCSMILTVHLLQMLWDWVSSCSIWLPKHSSWRQIGLLWMGPVSCLSSRRPSCLASSCWNLWGVGSPSLHGYSLTLASVLHGWLFSFGCTMSKFFLAGSDKVCEWLPPNLFKKEIAVILSIRRRTEIDVPFEQNNCKVRKAA